MISKICSKIASVAKDKILHAYVGSIVTIYSIVIISLINFLFYIPTWLIFLSSLICSSIVLIGKEIYDSKQPNNKFDWYDILADYIRAALVIIPLYIITL